MSRRRTVQSLVWMPHAVAIAVVDESLVQLHPAIVAAQEIEARHRLQPVESKWHIRLHCVSMRQHIAHDQMRLRHHLLAEQLYYFLSRQRLGDPGIDALDFAEMLVAEN